MKWWGRASRTENRFTPTIVCSGAASGGAGVYSTIVLPHPGTECAKRVQEVMHIKFGDLNLKQDQNEADKMSCLLE